MVLEVLVHVQGVEVLGVEAGEQHVHDDGDVDFLHMRQVGIGVLLILDALLHILVVEVEFADAVVGAVAGVVVGDDAGERRLLALGVLLVVGLFLRQVFLNLLHVLVALGRRGEDAGDVEWREVWVQPPHFVLYGLKQGVVLDGVVDAGGGQQGVELALVGGGVVLGQDGLDHLSLGKGLAGLGLMVSLGLVVIDMEAQDVAVFDGVGDGVLVQAALEQVVGGAVAGLLAFDLLIRGVLLEDGRAGEAEHLRVGKERLDGLVVVAELRAVAFVEDEHHSLAAQGFQALLVVALGIVGRVAAVAVIQRQAELLDGGDDDLVGIVVGEQAANKGFGVGVFFDAVFLEAVEFLARLAVQVLAVHHEQAFVDVRVVLEQGGGLERGERLAAAGGMPDIAIAAVLVDAVHDGLHGIYLVRPHHQQLLLTGHQHHIAADHLTQDALGEELLGKGIEVRDLLVILGGELVDGQEALVGIEAEMAGVVVGKVPGIRAVTDDEQLDEAEQRLAVAVARVVPVIDDLLHGAARADGQGLQLDLHHRHAVDEQHHVVAVVAVVGVDAQLVDDFKVVLAPVLDVHQGVVEGGAVVALEAVDAAQRLGSVVDVRRDHAVEQALEFAVGELDAVKRVELLAEIGFQSDTVADVRAIGVFEVAQLGEQIEFDLAFRGGHFTGPRHAIWNAIDGAV